MSGETPARATVCTRCQSQLSPALLACPSCGQLVYSEQLKRLVFQAEQATEQGDVTVALERWREALDLVPPGTRQAATIAGKLEGLGQSVGGPRAQAKQSPMPKWLAGLGAFGLLLWKLKFVLVFLLTKGKLLLLGLTKASTFFSMFLAFSLYMSLWGWKFALGLVATTYVHEMGHVAALRRLGFKADAPMFIPGFGAFVRLKQRPANPREDARIGLAGPIWGLAVSAVCMAIGLGFESAIWQAIGKWSALINLFNLLPVFSLDGARGFAALTKHQRGLATLSVLGAWLLTGEGLLLLLLAVCAYAIFRKDTPDRPDRTTLVTYVGLVVSLSLLMSVVVPMTGAG